MEPGFLINSIYTGTEGEGIHIGRPQIFVRFQGCLIGCRNCDSRETWDFQSHSPVSFQEVMDRIEKLGQGRLRRVSITGGDPLHPKHEKNVLLLSGSLKEKGYYVNIEASGMRIVDSIFRQVDFISFDYKTPSTGVRTPLSSIAHLQEHFRGKFQVKAVVADERDFTDTWTAYQEVQSMIGAVDFDWCLTPAMTPGQENMTPAMENFQAVIKLNESVGGPFRVIGQQHKWVYGLNAKEV